LVVRQLCDQVNGRISGEKFQRRVFGVVASGPQIQVFGGHPRGLRAPPDAAEVIGGPVPGDRGDPAVRVAMEITQVTGNLEPGFRRHVLGVGAHHRVQILQHARVGVPVEDAERFLVPRTCLPERFGNFGRLVPERYAGQRWPPGDTAH